MTFLLGGIEFKRTLFTRSSIINFHKNGWTTVEPRVEISLKKNFSKISPFYFLFQEPPACNMMTLYRTIRGANGTQRRNRDRRWGIFDAFWLWHVAPPTGSLRHCFDTPFSFKPRFRRKFSFVYSHRSPSSSSKTVEPEIFSKIQVSIDSTRKETLNLGLQFYTQMEGWNTMEWIAVVILIFYFNV